MFNTEEKTYNLGGVLQQDKEGNNGETSTQNENFCSLWGSGPRHSWGRNGTIRAQNYSSSKWCGLERLLKRMLMVLRF